jgi:choline kinase
MKALILAAGMGNRLGGLTKDKPKALIEVAGSLLVDRVLNFVGHPDVSEIGVVGGYCFDQLSEHLGGKDLHLFENKKYKDGNILTLMAALDFIDDDTLILNVDHIYPKNLLLHILNNVQGITAMCDFDRQLAEDDMKIKIDGNSHLKKISKQLTDFDGGYIGMTYCSRDMTNTYKKAVRDTFQTHGNEACVEWVLGQLADGKTDINICDTSGYRWLEVDTAKDLKNAEDALLKG